MNIPAKEFNYYTPRELDRTLDRLENWKRWAKDKPQYRVTPSLEGRYKSPQVWHPEEPRMPIDLNDAMAVERAIIKLPKPYKQIIIYRYIYPFINLQQFCRHAAIRLREFEVYERRAMDMIHNRLMRGDIFKQDIA